MFSWGLSEQKTNPQGNYSVGLEMSAWLIPSAGAWSSQAYTLQDESSVDMKIAYMQGHNMGASITSYPILCI